MKHLVESFASHTGERGAHFYDEEHCHFLNWKEVFTFLNDFPELGSFRPFSEKLTETLANYNPDHEFLAVKQWGDTVSVELYSHARQFRGDVQ